MRVTQVEAVAGAGGDARVEGCGLGEEHLREGDEIGGSSLDGGGVFAVAAAESHIAL